jgi:hypothetical protein
VPRRSPLATHRDVLSGLRSMPASGGHQAFPGGPCTPAILPVPAVQPTVAIRRMRHPSSDSLYVCFTSSRDCPLCANSGHSATALRTAPIDPKRTVRRQERTGSAPEAVVQMRTRPEGKTERPYLPTCEVVRMVGRRLVSVSRDRLIDEASKQPYYRRIVGLDDTDIPRSGVRGCVPGCRPR